jgi:hypothetical protein
MDLRAWAKVSSSICPGAGNRLELAKRRSRMRELARRTLVGFGHNKE